MLSALVTHLCYVPRLEWEQHVVLPAPRPLPSTTSACAAWWESKLSDFPELAPLAVFFSRRPRSACHVERTFSLLGRILTKGRLNVGSTCLRNLAIIYVNRTTDLDDAQSE